METLLFFKVHDWNGPVHFVVRDEEAQGFDHYTISDFSNIQAYSLMDGKKSDGPEFEGFVLGVDDWANKESTIMYISLMVMVEISTQ